MREGNRGRIVESSLNTTTKREVDQPYDSSNGQTNEQVLRHNYQHKRGNDKEEHIRPDLKHTAATTISSNKIASEGYYSRIHDDSKKSSLDNHTSVSIDIVVYTLWIQEPK